MFAAFRNVYIVVTQNSIWVFPNIGVPQNGWFMMETPIKMDDLGVPLFLETPISLHISCIFRLGSLDPW